MCIRDRLKVVRLSGEADPWGLAYRIIANRLQKPTQMVSMRSGNVLYTKPNEICTYFLEGLLPDDNVDTDEDVNTVIRQRAAAHMTIPERVFVSPDELLKSVKMQKSGKAPGLDGIRAEIIKRTMDRIKLLLLDTLNAIFTTGEFPKIWKQGELKVFLKSNGQGPQILKSYRPVTLLPVLGKIAERIIAGRLITFLEGHNFYGESQFGFRSGKSTTGAILSVQRHVNASVHLSLIHI